MIGTFSLLDAWLAAPLLALCLLASAFYSGVETGLMSVSRIRLRFRALRHRDRRVPGLVGLLRRGEDPILTCLIGTNLFNVLGSSLMTALMVLHLDAHGELVAGAVMSVLVIVFGEILPKVLYREHPEALTLASLQPLRLSMFLLAPVRLVLLAYSRLWRLLPSDGDEDRERMQRDAMASLLVRHSPAVGDIGFRELTGHCLELADLDLSSIARPLPDVVMVAADASLEDCRRASAASGFSRLPVHGHDREDVRGWVLARDLLFADAETWRGIPADLIRTPIFVDRRISPWALFEEMRWQRQQMAIVTDGEGRAVGLTTLEDLLEILVGRIEDEFDRSLRRPAASAS